MKLKLFSGKQIVYIWLGFAGVVLMLHFILRQIRYQVFFDMDNYWPVSIFLPKIPAPQDAVILLGIILLWWAFLRYWDSAHKSIWKITFLIGALIVATTALQGIKQGFVFPITGTGPGSITYYVDIQGITDPVKLLTSYTTIQSTLRAHSRVHPPGAMLFSYLLDKIWHEPIFTSVAQALIGLLSIPLLYGVLRKRDDSQWAFLGATILGLLPATQIYYLSSLDAVVVVIFLMIVYLGYQKLNQKSAKLQWQWLMITAVILWLAAFISFAVLVLISVILFIDWQKNQRLTWSLPLLGITVAIFFVVYNFTGFNYLNSLAIATKYEGPPQFYLLAEPLSYVATRIEDCLEILVFFTPWLAYLLVRQFKQQIHKYKQVLLPRPSVNNFKKLVRQQPIINIGLVVVGALILFFLAGAYYTGETARAANFIYPFLIMLVIPIIERAKPGVREQKLLLSLIFLQTVVMQTFGWFVW